MTQKMKLYSTGIRKIYFVFIRLASLAYLQKSPFRVKMHSFENIIAVARKGLIQWAYLVNEEHLKKVLDFYLAHFMVLFNLEKRLERQRDDFFEKHKRFDKQFFCQLNRDDLAKLYQETFHLMRCYLYINQLVWHLDFAGSKFVREKLSDQFSLTDIQTLTQPDEQSYLEKEEVEFLKMTKQYSVSTPRERGNLLAKHLKNYAWVTLSYHEEPAQTKSDCLNRIAELRRKHYGLGDIRKLFVQKKNFFKARIKKRDRLFEKIKDYKVKKAVLLLRQAAHLKNFYRGGLAQVTYFYFNPLMAEIGHRIKTPAGFLKDITDREMEALMRGEKINFSEIKRRTKEFYVTGCFKKKFFLVYGEKAKQLERKYFGELAKEGGDLKGTTAHKGVVRGIATVVLNYDDFGKVKQGDILIASNTTPDFMPVLGKLKAIVTELGGMTSHAAIVARELNKPAIIGVKNVTKIIKDGDMVEVDADQGIVKILKT